MRCSGARQLITLLCPRSKLKLRNSSNPVGRYNNLVTARRQKHQGMSWSENGSYALTALNAVTINNATKLWTEDRVIPFTWGGQQLLRANRRGRKN